jgi:nucleoside-diphosphate-sugar epimerase
MRVLVSGAGGFLGRHVVQCLLERGHQVRAIVRPFSREPSWSKPVDLFRADLRSSPNLVLAFDDIDAVIHLAAAVSGDEDLQFASGVVGTERFLDAMVKTPVKRLVHVSSIVVYDWGSARKSLAEETPLLKEPYAMGGYTIAKVWQERVILKFSTAHSLQLTIMRPGFVWGSQHAEIGGMGRHFGRAFVMFGPCTRLPLTHVFNCADCIMAALENPAAVGEAFNVVDDDSVRVWRYVREYVKRIPNNFLLVPVPYVVGLGIAKLAAKVSRVLFGAKGKLPSLLTPRRYEQQFKPIRFSNRKLRETLHWKPPLSLDECLKETYDNSLSCGSDKITTVLADAKMSGPE